MKTQVLAALVVLIVLTACYANVGNASPQASVTIQSSGTIKQAYTGPSNYTVILRGINVADLNLSPAGIDAYVANFVGNHAYANAVTISDMEVYDILWYGYSFSNTTGTWMGLTFQQLERVIDDFHSYGWKVGIESTAIAWIGEPEYNYIETLHPELAFTNAQGVSAAVTDKGTDNVIMDPFAVYATPDTTNNIPVGACVIDVYTTRLTQMIKDGLSWNFWFGSDGWNGLDNEGYSWDSTTASSCYSFSVQEENDYATWSGALLPSGWVSLSQTGKANAIISNPAILNSWNQYWQIRFAQEYAQIKQAFINAGESPNTFHTIGVTDESTPDGGNLSPAGMYNMTDLAQYNSIDYFYVDQEGTQMDGATYDLGPEQAYVGAYLKGLSPSLDPIIGLQPVNWLGQAFPLWEVEQEYLSQAINYVWYNGTRHQVSAPNVIMMQYPIATGWVGWSASEMNSLFTFINSTIASLQNATPIYLGPTYAMSITKSGSYGMALWGMNYSIAQWAPTVNLVNNPQYINANMGTLILDEALSSSGGPVLTGDSSAILSLWASGQLNLWYYECTAGSEISSTGLNEAAAEAAFHITPSTGNSLTYTVLSGLTGEAQWIASQYEGTSYSIIGPPATQVSWYAGVYTAQSGFTTIAAFTTDSPNTIADGYFKNSTSSMFMLTHLSSQPNQGNYAQLLPRSMVNNMLYAVTQCPITTSNSLVDLKIYSGSNGNIIIPMTDQQDVGDSFTIPSTLTTTLTINTMALGLTQPAQDYSVYWASAPNTLMPLSSSGSVTVTLNGGADVLVISPN